VASPSKPRSGSNSGDRLSVSTGTAPSDSSEAAKPETASGHTALTVERFAGRVLSHYRLEEQLGAGGMGVLHRATDLKLGRRVAIKLLARHLVSDETANARFVREARAASALDHPNIANVHEIGEQDAELFIVMALYEGETLKQRLNKSRLAIDEAIAIFRQVLLGVEAAHRAGIVHRDIKPANIFVTSDGTVKILDFGLAKLVSGSQAETLTQVGQAMGTVLYMSPEQLRGESVDSRSDLWSLGALAYEMLAGISPFQTDSSATTVARILNDEPPPLAAVPGIPDWLAEVVSQLLKKNPAERPQTASEVRERLDLAMATTPDRGKSRRRKGRVTPSVAVLPFTDMSPGKDQEHFADGVSEEILSALSQLKGLQVIGRTSSFSFKGKDEDLRSIGQKLNVAHILEGSVRKQGARVRITAQLINVADGFHVWSQQFDRNLTDIFAVQEEIANAVVEGFKIKLMRSRAAVPKRRRPNLEAYEQYLIGMGILNGYPRDGAPRAQKVLERALDLDPDFAPAWSGLSMALALMHNWHRVPTEQRKLQQQALAAADKAVELGAKLAETWARRGLLRMQVSWDWKGAEEDISHALAINPQDALSNDAQARLYAVLGRAREAIAAGSKATEVDRLNYFLWIRLQYYFVAAGQLENARRALGNAEEIAPESLWVSWARARLNVLEGQGLEALSTAPSFTNDGDRFTVVALAQHALGREAESNQALDTVIEGWSDVDAYQIAEVFAERGEKDRAFEWLERAYVQHDGGLVAVLPNNPSLKCNPFLGNLRGDPRWAALLKKMNLPLD